MALRLARRQQRLPSNPSLIRFLSNSSSDSPPQVVNASDEKSSQSPPSLSPSDLSYSSPFIDIKTTLKQKLQNHQEQGRNPFARSDAQTQSSRSLQDLGKNLAKFQRRSTIQPSQSPPQISLEALYKQNAAQNSADPRNRNAQTSNSNNVWENFKKLRTQTNTSNNMEKKGVNLQSFNNTLKNLPKENVSSNVFEGAFLKSLDDRKGREGETEEMVTEFLTSYNEEELGEKLKMLRPEGEKEEGWFSLQELNQRLVKLRQVEEKEAESRTRNFAALRNVISSFKNDPHKNEVISQQNITILGHLGGIPEYKHYPPKEELVDTYFHPDNMSSAEKIKIELTKVREEFKMSESDCGSARVQVAQLTTKIKHLSSTLHKKDKHSRKGLLGMVQKRKKLLKYLRRTDWDSYCLVLSKLSLRDNPDYKF